MLMVRIVEEGTALGNVVEQSWSVYISCWLGAAAGVCKLPDTSRLSEGTGKEVPVA